MVFTLLGRRCEFLGCGYNCPSLKLYGYKTERQLANAIRQTLNAQGGKKEEARHE